jgi:hypothetical protein
MSDQQTVQAPRGPLDKVAGRAPADTPRTQGAVTMTPVEASQGFKLGRMRWVLGISLALVIVAMAVAYAVAR